MAGFLSTVSNSCIITILRYIPRGENSRTLENDDSLLTLNN